MMKLVMNLLLQKYSLNIYRNMVHSYESPTNKIEDKKMDKVKELIESGILSFAKDPDGNPENLDFTSYTITFIEHDYPAKTPIMWNAVYEKWGIDYGNVMLIGDTTEIPKIFESLKKDTSYMGGGVGVGFKDKASVALDKLDPLAEQIGSVNFVLKNEKGELVGYNTDGEGYAVSLEELFEKRGEDLNEKKVVVLGAGGTGRAIVFALAKRDANIVILNRTVEKAEELAKSVASYFDLDDKMVRFGGEEDITKEIQDADVILNVSTKGTSGSLENYSPLAPAKLPATEENINKNRNEADNVLLMLRENTIISDIILRNEPTPFLKIADSAGFETLNGVPMVVNQGVEALWLLHGGELEEKGATKKEVYEVMKNAARL